GQRQSVRRWRHVLGGDLGHLRDRLDDVTELRGVVVELFVGERQPGQPGQMRDLVAGYGGHESLNPFRGWSLDTHILGALTDGPRTANTLDTFAVSRALRHLGLKTVPELLYGRETLSQPGGGVGGRHRLAEQPSLSQIAPDLGEPHRR